MKSTISARGRITIPAEVRNRLGLVPGTEVELELRDGEIVLRKGLRSRHPVDRVFGILKLDEPVDALLDDMRGPRS
jgi:AbrB family looped-hinge helix DNA binding protein